MAFSSVWKNVFLSNMLNCIGKYLSINISREEFQAIKELKKDEQQNNPYCRQGVVMVVLNKEDYIKEAKHLLNQPTYKKMTEDPTSKQKARLIKLLRNIKAQGGITEEQYKKMYPTGAGAPKFYGLPKNSQTRYTFETHSFKYRHS